jgi:exodeoxyribonuclease III
VSVAYDCQLPASLVEAGGKGAKLCPGEGRTVTVEFPGFYLINCYVPNSGQDLVRLDYRTKTWDPALRAYLQALQQHKPVIFAGDLNCGHLDLDIWNCHAKHIPKQSGLTPEEREGFSNMLTSGRQPCPPAPAAGVSSGFIDALRYCYPFARGQFSYWSQRSFARPVNKGIRLDYFICSRSFVAPYEEAAAGDDSAGGMEAIVREQENQALAEITAAPTVPRTLTSCLDLALQRSTTTAAAAAVRVPALLDSYTLPHDTVGISDHAPVMLVLQV